MSSNRYNRTGENEKERKTNPSERKYKDTHKKEASSRSDNQYRSYEKERNERSTRNYRYESPYERNRRNDFTERARNQSYTHQSDSRQIYPRHTNNKLSNSYNQNPRRNEKESGLEHNEFEQKNDTDIRRIIVQCILENPNNFKSILENKFFNFYNNKTVLYPKEIREANQYYQVLNSLENSKEDQEKLYINLIEIYAKAIRLFDNQIDNFPNIYNFLSNENKFTYAKKILMIYSRSSKVDQKILKEAQKIYETLLAKYHKDVEAQSLMFDILTKVNELEEDQLTTALEWFKNLYTAGTPKSDGILLLLYARTKNLTQEQLNSAKKIANRYLNSDHLDMHRKLFFFYANHDKSLALEYFQNLPKKNIAGRISQVMITILIEEGNIDEAERIYFTSKNKGILTPDNASIELIKVITGYVSLHDAENEYLIKAEKLLTRESTHGNSILLFNNLLNESLQAHQYNNIDKCFSSDLLKDERNGDSYYVMIMSYINRNMLVEAKDLFDKLSTIRMSDKQMTEIDIRILEMYIMNLKLDEALSFFDKIPERLRTDSHLSWLGKHLNANKQTSSTIEIVEPSVNQVELQISEHETDFCDEGDVEIDIEGVSDNEPTNQPYPQVEMLLEEPEEEIAKPSDPQVEMLPEEPDHLEIFSDDESQFTSENNVREFSQIDTINATDKSSTSQMAQDDKNVISVDFLNLSRVMTQGLNKEFDGKLVIMNNFSSEDGKFSGEFGFRNNLDILAETYSSLLLKGSLPKNLRIICKIKQDNSSNIIIVNIELNSNEINISLLSQSNEAQYNIYKQMIRSTFVKSLSTQLINYKINYTNENPQLSNDFVKGLSTSDDPSKKNVAEPHKQRELFNQDKQTSINVDELRINLPNPQESYIFDGDERFIANKEGFYSADDFYTYFNILKRKSPNHLDTFSVNKLDELNSERIASLKNKIIVFRDVTSTGQNMTNYDLKLMSEFPSNGKIEATVNTIYISDTGEYIIYDAEKQTQLEAKIDTKRDDATKINFNMVENQIHSLDFKAEFLNILSKSGHIPNGKFITNIDSEHYAKYVYLAPKPEHLKRNLESIVSALSEIHRIHGNGLHARIILHIGGNHFIIAAVEETDGIPIIVLIDTYGGSTYTPYHLTTLNTLREAMIAQYGVEPRIITSTKKIQGTNACGPLCCAIGSSGVPSAPVFFEEMKHVHKCSQVVNTPGFLEKLGRYSSVIPIEHVRLYKENDDRVQSRPLNRAEEPAIQNQELPYALKKKSSKKSKKALKPIKSTEINDDITSNDTQFLNDINLSHTFDCDVIGDYNGLNPEELDALNFWFVSEFSKIANTPPRKEEYAERHIQLLPIIDDYDEEKANDRYQNFGKQILRISKSHRIVLAKKYMFVQQTLLLQIKNQIKTTEISNGLILTLQIDSKILENKRLNRIINTYLKKIGCTREGNTDLVIRVSNKEALKNALDEFEKFEVTNNTTDVEEINNPALVNLSPSVVANTLHDINKFSLYTEGVENQPSPISPDEIPSKTIDESEITTHPEVNMEEVDSRTITHTLPSLTDQDVKTFASFVNAMQSIDIKSAKNTWSKNLVLNKYLQRSQMSDKPNMLGMTIETWQALITIALLRHQDTFLEQVFHKDYINQYDDDISKVIALLRIIRSYNNTLIKKSVNEIEWLLTVFIPKVNLPEIKNIFIKALLSTHSRIAVNLLIEKNHLDNYLYHLQQPEEICKAVIDILSTQSSTAINIIIKNGYLDYYLNQPHPDLYEKVKKILASKCGEAINKLIRESNLLKSYIDHILESEDSFNLVLSIIHSCYMPAINMILNQDGKLPNILGMVLNKVKEDNDIESMRLIIKAILSTKNEMLISMLNDFDLFNIYTHAINGEVNQIIKKDRTCELVKSILSSKSSTAIEMIKGNLLNGYIQLADEEAMTVDENNPAKPDKIVETIFSVKDDSVFKTLQEYKNGQILHSYFERSHNFIKSRDIVKTVLKSVHFHAVIQHINDFQIIERYLDLIEEQEHVGDQISIAAKMFLKSRNVELINKFIDYKDKHFLQKYLQEVKNPQDLKAIKIKMLQDAVKLFLNSKNDRAIEILFEDWKSAPTLDPNNDSVIKQYLNLLITEFGNNQNNKNDDNKQKLYKNHFKRLFKQSLLRNDQDLFLNLIVDSEHECLTPAFIDYLTTNQLENDENKEFFDNLRQFAKQPSSEGLNPFFQFFKDSNKPNHRKKTNKRKQTEREATEQVGHKNDKKKSKNVANPRKKSKSTDDHLNQKSKRKINKLPEIEVREINSSFLTSPAPMPDIIEQNSILTAISNMSEKTPNDMVNEETVNNFIQILMDSNVILSEPPEEWHSNEAQMTTPESNALILSEKESNEGHEILFDLIDLPDLMIVENTQTSSDKGEVTQRVNQTTRLLQYEYDQFINLTDDSNHFLDGIFVIKRSYQPNMDHNHFIQSYFVNVSIKLRRIFINGIPPKEIHNFIVINNQFYYVGFKCSDVIRMIFINFIKEGDEDQHYDAIRDAASGLADYFSQHKKYLVMWQTKTIKHTHDNESSIFENILSFIKNPKELLGKESFFDDVYSQRPTLFSKLSRTAIEHMPQPMPLHAIDLFRKPALQRPPIAFNPKPSVQRPPIPVNQVFSGQGQQARVFNQTPSGQRPPIAFNPKPAVQRTPIAVNQLFSGQGQQARAFNQTPSGQRPAVGLHNQKPSGQTQKPDASSPPTKPKNANSG